MKKSKLQSALDSISTSDIKEALLEVEIWHNKGVLPDGVFNSLVREILAKTSVPLHDVTAVLENYLLRKVAFAWAHDKVEDL